MSRRLRTSIAAAFIASLCATTAFAQQAPPLRSVLENYQKGEKAIKDKQWDVAIASLNAAIAQDPRDRTYRDSVVTLGYFPHHYLFIAYSEKGDPAKARANYNLRGSALLPDLVTAEAPYVARLNAVPGAPGTSGGPGVPAGGTVAAVSERALTAYRAGLTALRASRWQDAATQFSNAIAIDATPKPEPAPDGYFPQYYLAIADLRLNKIDEAAANFDKRGTIARSMYLADEEAKFPKEVDFARSAPAGEDAFAKQQWATAVENLNKACAALPDECNSRGLRQKLNDATASQQRVAAANEVLQHVAQAKSLMGENDLDGARKEFQAAVAKDPTNADANAGLKDIQTREKNYIDSTARAALAMKANPPDLNAAKREYEAALAAHPRWFRDRDKLDARLTSINAQRLAAQGIEDIANEAKTAFQAGRYDAAKQTAETVLAKNPNYADMKSIVTRSESRILYEDGRKIAAAGDYLQADSKFKEAVQKDSTNAVAQKALDTSLNYQFLVSKKAYPQAKTLDRVRFDRDRPDLHFDVVDNINAANDAFTNADYGSARAKIEEAIKSDPTNASALALRRRIVAVTTAAIKADAGPIVAQPSGQQNAPLLLPMWMWATLAAVTFVGAGSIAVVRSRAPMPVAIDALPWAHVSIQPVGRFTKIARSEGTTPFSIGLPKGEYDLKVTSESMSEPYSLRINVVPGQTNKVLVTMPAYDVDEILSGLLG